MVCILSRVAFLPSKGSLIKENVADWHSQEIPRAPDITRPRVAGVAPPNHGWSWGGFLATGILGTLESLPQNQAFNESGAWSVRGQFQSTNRFIMIHQYHAVDIVLSHTFDMLMRFHLTDAFFAVSLSCPLLFVFISTCCVQKRTLGQPSDVSWGERRCGPGDPGKEASVSREIVRLGAPFGQLSSDITPPDHKPWPWPFWFSLWPFSGGQFPKFPSSWPWLTTDQVVSVGQVVARQWTILRDNAQQKVLLIKGPRAQPEMDLSQMISKPAPPQGSPELKNHEPFDQSKVSGSAQSILVFAMEV